MHRPTVIADEEMAVLQQGCHLLEALALRRENAAWAGQRSNPRHTLKIVPCSKQERSRSVVSYQGGRHLTESFRVPGARGLRGAWMQGDSKSALMDSVPAEETERPIPGLRGEMVAEPAIGYIGTHCFNDLEKVLCVMPLLRERKGIRQQPSPGIALKPHSAGDAGHPCEQSRLKGLLE